MLIEDIINEYISNAPVMLQYDFMVLGKDKTSLVNQGLL